MTARSFARIAAALLIAGVSASAAALSPDERGRERIRGDDDPVIVPASVAMPERVDLSFFDPETTGSIKRKPARSRPLCQRFAFYPENPIDKQFREAC
jgi:hypothetical protein